MKQVITIITFVFLQSTLLAQVRLPRLVRDSMILQRDTKINIWGWASPKEKLSIRFNNKSYKTAAGADGKWLVQLAPMKAGGPYTMDITASNKISLKDILIGDVWVCSGQSNMVHQLNIHDVTYADDITNANYPQIRHFWIPTLTSLEGPKEDLPTGYWKPAIATEIRPFSAVAYFFARKIYEKYHVPVGLINASVGGSPIEAWTSEEGLKEFPAIQTTIQKNKDTAYVSEVNRKAFAANRPLPPKDQGISGPIAWYEISYQANGWHTINIPGYWEDQGLKDLNGIVWYRKEIDIPASMVGKPARVFLGRIVDADILYINGKQVGLTTYMYPQRRYTVPPDLLKAGKNIFVVKVTNTNGKGGFVPGKPYCLFAGTDTIDLKGDWQYKVGEVYEPRSPGPPSINVQNQPTALYNAMLAPITNYTIKGFCWYQGESNTSRAEEYTKLQPAMVADWRNRWKQGDLPFLYVQLPNFMDASYLPSESQWADFRYAQLKCLSVPNSAMAVAIDLGEWNDLHPDNKKDVGERLALAALKLGYNENIVYSGPLYQSAVIDGNKITISFTHVGSGLITKDGEAPAYFSIAGADKKFVWANAKIEGDKIVVWSDRVANPVYVRSAWADNPDGANLYNKEGLPASPFETGILQAGSNAPWRNKKAAVVLTYDDAIDQHLDNAIPVLDSLGLKATFYITGFSASMQSRFKDWKQLAANGHELGNHTLYHPCTGGKGREWVRPDYDLNNYTIPRIVDEIRATNLLLQSMDGKTRRTFAFTCADTKVKDSSFAGLIKNDFAGLRNVRHEMHPIGQVNPDDIDCYMVNGQTAAEMTGWVKKAVETNSLLVILFHGVGGGNGLDVSIPAHRELLNYLKQNEKDIWVAPMVEVVEHVRSWKKGLKDHYSNYFPIGVAVSPGALKTDEAGLILGHFNSMTPENAMKMGPIHPRENEYNWAGGDSIAAFAKRNNLKLRGHTLCWHNQTPAWFFTNTAGDTVSKEVLLQRLRDHITAVVTRYKGTIYAWDVVNEVISDRPDEYFRNSPFYRICGEEFVAKAFQYAHEADPGALLFYNDYNEINTVKREKIYKLVKSLKDAGVPIHGVGLQGHWAISEPTEGQLDSTIKRFTGLGLKIQVTELDISVYPKEHNARERKASDYDTAFSAEKEAKQIEVYKTCFKIFRTYKDFISGVTFWNISDRHSWLDNFPVRGRKDHPLLFDKNLQPKKAYWEVIKF